jgi:hypothetical protein
MLSSYAIKMTGQEQTALVFPRHTTTFTLLNELLCPVARPPGPSGLMVTGSALLGREEDSGRTV